MGDCRRYLYDETERRLEEVDDWRAEGYWALAVLLILLGALALCLIVSGCSSTPLEVRAVTWSGEGAVSVETTAESVAVSIAYVGILEPAGGEAVHCPVVSVDLGGTVAMSLYGVPPSSEDVPIDARCYEAIGALGVRMSAQASSTETVPPAD